MKQLTLLITVLATVFVIGAFSLRSANVPPPLALPPEKALATKFEYLSTHGNSSCSAAFTTSIAGMPDNARLQGSCCSPMSLDEYRDQVVGLRKYAGIPEIPQDPYDINAGLAKKLVGYYDLTLTPEQQKAYDYAMAHSREHGPCCCKCWRWNVYGGLAKYLITRHQFTGEQVTEVWNLSDGCGGNDQGKSE